MTRSTSTIIRDIAAGAGVATAICAGALYVGADKFFRRIVDLRDGIEAPLHTSTHVNAADEETDVWFTQTRQSVTLTSSDGLRLHAWLFDPDCVCKDTHRYAICLHGRSEAPRIMAPWAHHYAKLGCTVLVPAQRAHELSEGRYTGLGYLESDDLLRWIQLVVAADEDARIVLHGNAMGATAAMIAAGSPRLPRNVVAAVSDSGYASARDQLIFGLQRTTHMPHLTAVACVDMASLLCKRRAGYDFRQASCADALRHATVPMLFIHGGGDIFVSPAQMRRNYDACSSIDRDMLLIPGAAHAQGAIAAPDLYWRKVTHFMERVFARK